MEPLKSPPDWERSPLTGYSRAHWLEIVERMVRGVLGHVDEHGIPRFSRDEKDAGLAKHLRNPGGDEEAFDRTHLLMAVYIAATGKTRIDGFSGDIGETYRQGMVWLYDPGRAGIPPRASPSASAFAMLLVPDEFLTKLPEKTRAHLIEHLRQFIHRPTRDSNTMLFSMMPAAILEKLGASYDRELLEGYFDRILSMYRGGGWFIDGWNRGFDFYNFWGFQFYLHALMVHDAAWRQRYGERVREITRAHEAWLPLWFGRDGAPIAKGRSLNYRFAVLSGIGYGQLSGLASMDPGLARRISSGCLKFFVENGCLGERGLLEVGFLGANGAIGEDYTDRGAPYWASTGLAALALPPDHAFWTAREAPLPADKPAITRHVATGGQMVLKAGGPRGEARAIIAGEPFLHRSIWQAGAKYFQHAYSSSLGFALTGENGPQLAMGRTGISIDGKEWAYRTWPRPLRIEAHLVESEWDAWPAVEGMTGSVITRSRILDAGEMHTFWHTAEAPRHLCIGGWAIQVPHDTPLQTVRENHQVRIESATMWSVLELFSPEIEGRIEVEEIHPREGFVHAHLLGGWSAFVVWRSSRPLQPHEAVTVFVDAGRAGDHLSARH